MSPSCSAHSALTARGNESDNQVFVLRASFHVMLELVALHTGVRGIAGEASSLLRFPKKSYGLSSNDHLCLFTQLARLVPDPSEDSELAHCYKLGASSSGRSERVVSEMRYPISTVELLSGISVNWF